MLSNRSLLPFDKAVGQWYHINNREDYFDNNDKGLYLRHFIDEEYCDKNGEQHDDSLFDEFSGQLDTKSDDIDLHTDVDPNFPIPPDLALKQEDRTPFIFAILKWCYNNHLAPTIGESIEIITKYIANKYGIYTDHQLAMKWVKLIEEPFENELNFISYIAISNALQIYHQKVSVFHCKIGKIGKIGLINYNIHDKATRKSLYGVISFTNHNKIKQLIDFMTDTQLNAKYGVNHTQLPTPSYFINISSSNDEKKENTAPKTTDKPISKKLSQNNGHLNTKKNKKKSGKRKNKNPIKTGHSYDPPNSRRAQRNIQISRTLTNEIIPNQIDEHVSNVYAYIDKSVGLQIHKQKNDGIMIIDCDFHDKNSKEKLYLVAEPQDASKHRGYKYGMRDKLFTAKELETIYNISATLIPKTVRSTQEFTVNLGFENKIKTILMNKERRQEIINKCSWHKLDIFNRQNNKRRMTLSITKPEFISDCTKFGNNMNAIHLIPILMFNNNNNNNQKVYLLQFVWMVEIHDCNIGIAMEYNASKDHIIIQGLHLDKEYIQNQHELVSPQHAVKCDCLDQYRPNIITYLAVGNPDDQSNQLMIYKQKSERFAEFIKSDVIGDPSESYEKIEKAKNVLSNNYKASVVSKKEAPVPATMVINNTQQLIQPPVVCNNTAINMPLLTNNMYFVNPYTIPINTTGIPIPIQPLPQIQPIPCLPTMFGYPQQTAFQYIDANGGKYSNKNEF